MTTAPSADSSAPPAGGARLFDRVVVVALVVQLVGLGIAAAQHRLDVNPDAIAYAQAAEHVAAWNTDLMINGYWGPLLSWIAVPFLAVTGDALLAVRLAMVVSGVVFLLGTARALGLLGVSGLARTVGVGLAAGAGVAWSVASITPDLLLAGLFAAGAAEVLTGAWTTSRRAALRAGVLLGLAYLSKAVALPSAIGLVIVMAALGVWRLGVPWAAARRSALATLGGLLVCAVPWIVLLSIEYGHFTFSTTGKIAHSVVGPSDVERWYPTFRTLHVPEAGRITSWEDPTGLDYVTWSPVGGLGLLRHQLRVVMNNVVEVLGHLSRFDLLRLGPGLLIVALVFNTPWGAGLARERWRLALVPLACMCGLYLPVFAYAERYFWAAYPFLLAGGLGLAGALPVAGGVRRAATLVVAASFALGLVSWDVPGFTHSVAGRPGLVRALTASTNGSGPRAQTIADGLRAADLSGPVASDARDGLYVAYFLGEPWYGETLPLEAAALREIGASIVVARHAETVAHLTAEAGFEDVTDRVLGDDASEIGLRVFAASR